jgi:hypothetical protein
MDRELSPGEIEDLLPAYALDAVDDDERAAIDDYLARTPSARDDVAELQTAASMLAHTGGPPPDGVWERLESIIAVSRPPLRSIAPPDVPAPPHIGARSRRDRRWQWIAAAAAVVALVFAGLWAFNGSSDSRDTAALARAAQDAPGARHAVLTDSAGRTLATAVVLRDGTGYLTSALPHLPAGRTYQLWGITKKDTISLGVLGPKPSVVAFKAAAPTKRLAITTERAGGVAVTGNAPDAAGDVRTT